MKFNWKSARPCTEYLPITRCYQLYSKESDLLEAERVSTQVEERVQYGKPVSHLYGAAKKKRQMLFQLLCYVFPVKMEMMNVVEQDASDKEPVLK